MKQSAEGASTTAANAAASFPFAFPAPAAKAAVEPESPARTAPSSAGPSTADAEAGVQSTFPGAPLPNPAVWWNMLQDQFKQAVSTAMAADPAVPLPTPEQTAAMTNPKPGPVSAAAPAPRKRKTEPPKSKGG